SADTTAIVNLAEAAPARRSAQRADRGRVLRHPEGLLDLVEVRHGVGEPIRARAQVFRAHRRPRDAQEVEDAVERRLEGLRPEAKMTKRSAVARAGRRQVRRYADSSRAMLRTVTSGR